MTKHLVIIDGYGFLFRAYHSMPPLTRQDNTPVGAIYGFTSMIMRITSMLECSHIAVALDSGTKSFRNDIYKEYKAHRPPAPEDLIPQFPILREAINALNIKILEKNGFEADDLIATYAVKANKEGFKVTIVSSDKDLMQLIVKDEIAMYDAMKNKFIGEQEVEEKFGVGPKSVLDVLSLIGDSSDNIPGVPGIGPKTASELINLYTTLENLYENTHLITQQKRRENIENNKDVAFLSKKLITLDINVEYPMTIEQLVITPPDTEKLVHFLQTQNFKSLVSRIGAAPKEQTKLNAFANLNNSLTPNVAKITPLANYLKEEILNKQKFIDIFSEAKQLGLLAIDYDYDEKLHNITKIYLATSDTKTYFAQFSFDNIQTNMLDKKGFFLSDIKSFLCEAFSDKSILKIGYNIKRILHLFDIDNIESFEDVELASYVVANGIIANNFLNLISFHLGEELSETHDNNASLLIRLWNIIKQKLYQEKMLTLYNNIEKPLVRVLYDMEKAGIKADVSVFKKLSSSFAEKISFLEKKIFNEAGCEFNIGSPKQLSEVLFQNMGLQLHIPAKKNKTQSTNAEVLEELVASGYSIAKHVLDWRHLSKLKNTYTDSLPKQIDKNSRIHTTFIMTSTNTGRLSSVDPNLQNIPIRTNEGNLIRSAFIAEEGKQLISLDYSQIELRLLAHIANVEPLIQAFKNNIDIHKATASEMFNVDLDKVDDDLRRKAKTINFGIIYGISAFGLSNRLGIPRNVAKNYIDIYFKRYPEILEYMEKTKDFAKTHGYVQTLFGRKCYLKTINSKNAAERNFAERAAINAPLQGTQADIIKIAMSKICNDLQKNNSSAKMILQIHDELIFEDIISNAPSTADLAKNIMENVAHYKVPLTVDVRIGKNWMDI